MKTDTQHLDYLLSQYVDGCLEGANKKTLEQRLVIDPETRRLYKEHHDVQDMLDDWGSRIPWINWDEFDQKLARRLEHEVVGGQAKSIFYRWIKPLSVAAGLAIAVSVGYGWHAWSVQSVTSASRVAVAPASAPNHAFAVEDSFSPGQGSIARVRVDESMDSGSPLAATAVNVTAPGNVEAADALREAITMGLPSVRQTAQAGAGDASSAHVAAVFPTPKPPPAKEGPAFP